MPVNCAVGFCVFNDLGVVIETLRADYGIQRIGYVDIDVHHGDGVSHEEDPELIFADIHEDGRSLYPGTGHATDRQGLGEAPTNIPATSGRCAVPRSLAAVVAHLRKFHPQFIVFQCGADGLQGDLLAHLRYSMQVHARYAQPASSGGRDGGGSADGFRRGRLSARQSGASLVRGVAKLSRWTRTGQSKRISAMHIRLGNAIRIALLLTERPKLRHRTERVSTLTVKPMATLFRQWVRQCVEHHLLRR
jgi:hypothetical protein